MTPPQTRAWAEYLVLKWSGAEPVPPQPGSAKPALVDFARAYLAQEDTISELRKEVGLKATALANCFEQRVTELQAHVSRLVEATPAGYYDALTEARQKVATLTASLEANEAFDAATRQSVMRPLMDQAAVIQQLRDALTALVSRLDEVHADERYQAVWQCYMIHGGVYLEPTYTRELQAAKAVLESVKRA